MSDAMIAGWSRAEENLYTPLLADPGTYERVVRVVGALADYLREHVFDVAELSAASSRGADLAREVLGEEVLPWMPLADAVGAACAIRYREVRVIEARAHRTRALQDAAASGQPWVRIVDPNSSVAARVAPALFVLVGTGMAISCTTDLDPDTGGVCFTATPVTVDPVSGDVMGPLDSIGPARSAASTDDREADVRELQHRIESYTDRSVG